MALEINELSEFIESSKTLNELEEEISRSLDIEREINGDYANSVIQNLNFHGFKTTQELEETLNDYKEKVQAFTEYAYQNDWFQNLRSGISLWYLSYALFDKAHDVFVVRQFLDELDIKAHEERKALANDIFNLSRQL